MTVDIRAQAASNRPSFTIDAFGRALRRYAIFIILAALVAFFHHAEPAFLRVNNLFSVLQSVAVGQSPTLSQQVSTENQQANSMGFDSTPTLVFKGPKSQTQPIKGALTYAGLQEAIKSVT